MLNRYSLKKPIPHHPRSYIQWVRLPSNFSGYAPDIAGLTVTSTVSASIQPAIVNNAKTQKQLPTFSSFVQPISLNAPNGPWKRTMESLNIDFALLSVLSDDQAVKHVEEFLRTSGRQI